jgi:hypothetical protein
MPAMPNGRCRMHGGTNTGAPPGNDNAVKHGIYRSTLTEGERADYDSLQLGDVDHELRLVRVRLARALKAERDGNDPKRDYTATIDSLLARIAGLELTRKKLGDAADEDTLPVLVDPNPDV